MGLLDRFALNAEKIIVNAKRRARKNSSYPETPESGGFMNERSGSFSLESFLTLTPLLGSPRFGGRAAIAGLVSCGGLSAGLAAGFAFVRTEPVPGDEISNIINKSQE